MLICPNHQSHFDIPVLRRALGRHGRHRLAVAAADDYWFQRRLYKLVVSWFAAVPFRRMGRGAESIRAVEGLLDDGWRVVIFPEGTRSRTGAIGHFKPGAGLIAVHGAWRCCRSGSTACGTSCRPAHDGHDGHGAAGRGCDSGNPWSPPRAKRPRFTERLEAAVRAL